MDFKNSTTSQPPKQSLGGNYNVTVLNAHSRGLTLIHLISSWKAVVLRTRSLIPTDREDPRGHGPMSVACINIAS